MLHRDLNCGLWVLHQSLNALNPKALTGLRALRLRTASKTHETCMLHALHACSPESTRGLKLRASAATRPRSSC